MSVRSFHGSYLFALNFMFQWFCVALSVFQCREKCIQQICARLGIKSWMLQDMSVIWSVVTVSDLQWCPCRLNPSANARSGLCLFSLSLSEMPARESVPSVGTILGAVALVLYFAGFLRVELQMREQRSKIDFLEMNNILQESDRRPTFEQGAFISWCILQNSCTEVTYQWENRHLTCLWLVTCC